MSLLRVDSTPSKTGVDERLWGYQSWYYKTSEAGLVSGCICKRFTAELQPRITCEQGNNHAVIVTPVTTLQPPFDQKRLLPALKWPQGGNVSRGAERRNR